MDNIAHALTRQAQRQPDAPALIIPIKPIAGGWKDKRYSYQELETLSNELAAGLHHHGLTPGTRVALMVPPSLEFFALFFALFKAGCVPVLIDPGIGLKPLKTCLAEAKPQAFVGVPKAQIARWLFGWAKQTIKTSITVGPTIAGLSYQTVLKAGRQAEQARPTPHTQPEDPAAILFTSGSTGIPKGVVYRHRHFVAQVDLIQRSYAIQPGEVDCPTFPPFALFDPALGMTTVIPKMDFTRPAKVDPKMLVSLIQHYGVTNLFGSPALMHTLSTHTKANKIKLPGLKRVLSAGAPVQPKVIERMHLALSEHADLHTPYGATECLPVATVSGREILSGLAARHRNGQGICVGKPLPENQVILIAISDEPIELKEHATVLGPNQIGEICVSGPSVTDQYWQRPAQTQAAKMTDADGTIWHRMGDLGWQDEQGRLWFCGRKSERVPTEHGERYTECVEGPVNAVPGVYRSALVEWPKQSQKPAVVLELEANADQESVIKEVKAVLKARPHSQHIDTVRVHSPFPVDIRHNAKIRRQELADKL